MHRDEAERSFAPPQGCKWTGRVGANRPHPSSRVPRFPSRTSNRIHGWYSSSLHSSQRMQEFKAAEELERLVCLADGGTDAGEKVPQIDSHHPVTASSKDRHDRAVSPYCCSR
eukprot:8795305-Pyramimonas_sp.AAC.1